MPKWAEYKEISRSRGSLALELYAAISTPVDIDKMKEVLPAHLAYQGELEAKSQLVLAGPLSDLSGEEMMGVGLIIYRAASLEEARALADADPAHALQARTYTLQRWLVNEGSFTLELSLSTQKLKIS